LEARIRVRWFSTSFAELRHYACTVKDLLLSVPVCSVVASCVRKSFTDDQLQIAYLLKKCVMARDGLSKLPDCLTVGDMSNIASYLSTC